MVSNFFSGYLPTDDTRATYPPTSHSERVHNFPHEWLPPEPEGMMGLLVRDPGKELSHILWPPVGEPGGMCAVQDVLRTEADDALAEAR